MKLNTRQANFLAKIKELGDDARSLADRAKDLDESWTEEFNGNRDNSIEILELDTTVNTDSASGQPVLSVASNIGARIGDEVIINKGGAREETKTIQSVGSSSLTFTENLVYDHLSADADEVRTMGALYVLGLNIQSINQFCNRFCANYVSFWDGNSPVNRDYGKIVRRIADNQ